MTSKKPSVLLPQHFVPHHYDIRITPDMNKWTFDGQEAIHFARCNVENANYKCVSIHALDLELRVQDTSVTSSSNKIACTGITYDEKMQTANLYFEQDLPEQFELHIGFSGTINDKLCGFYRSKYVDTKTNETKFVGTTQFEGIGFTLIYNFLAVDARRAFPCFDEPSQKATFTLTLVIPSHLEALSNMPIATKTETNSIATVTFEKSARMSTYLVAWCIGEWESVEATCKSGVVVRVFIPKNSANVEHCKFALETGKNCLDFFDDFFKVPYPLPKYDMVAISDFAAGYY